LADDKIRHHALICRLGYHGRGVVNSCARCKVAVVVWIVGERMMSAEKVGHCEERGDERDYRRDRAERRHDRVLRLLVPLSCNFVDLRRIGFVSLSYCQRSWCGEEACRALALKTARKVSDFPKHEPNHFEKRTHGWRRRAP
jgi:hypothetical protein